MIKEVPVVRDLQIEIDYSLQIVSFSFSKSNILIFNIIRISLPISSL